MVKRKIKILNVTPHQDVSLLKDKGNCYIAVSINNDFYKNKEKVLVLLDFIKNHFSSCTIVVADYLYRHNLNLISPEKSQTNSNSTEELGDKIIKLINPLIKNDLDFFKVRRWKDFYNTTEYTFYEKHILELYNSDKSFKTSILKTSNTFVQRLETNKKLLANNKDIAVNHSVQFILEEIIVFCVLAEKGLNIDIYPGTYLQVLKDISLGKYPKSPLILQNRISVEVKTIRKKPVANNVSHEKQSSQP